MWWAWRSGVCAGSWTIPSWSITKRLTLLYAVTAFGMMAVATVFLYSVLKKDLIEEDYPFLSNKIHFLRDILHEHPDGPRALLEEVAGEGDGSPASEYFARVLDKEGRILVETPEMTRILPPSLFRRAANSTDIPTEAMRWKSAGGRAYLLMAAWASVGPRGEEERLVQVAMDFYDHGSPCPQMSSRNGVSRLPVRRLS